MIGKVMCRFLLVSSVALLLSGCSLPWAQSKPGAEPIPPALPAPGEPVLLLDLPLEGGPDYPGRLPGRVGGVSPRGPSGLAVGQSEEIYLIDTAQKRLMIYEGGQFQRALSLPWLGEDAHSLQIGSDQFYIRSDMIDYAVDFSGRILGTGLPRPIQLIVPDPGPPPPPGDLAAKAYSPGGGIYSLTWHWEGGEIGRAQVHRLRSPSDQARELGEKAVWTEPVALGMPVPEAVLIDLDGWRPVRIDGAVELQNLWRLIGAPDQVVDPPGQGEQHVLLTALLPSGEQEEIRLSAYWVSSGDKTYALRGPTLLNYVYALAFSPSEVRSALAEAEVRLEIADLPGTSRLLSQEERSELVGLLQGATTVQFYSAPQPLEAPFPRYAFRLAGPDWEGYVSLRGARHLALGGQAAITVAGDLASFVSSRLPVPELDTSDLAYLYLAERVEMEGGGDLTRWKATIVRALTGAEPMQPGFEEYKGNLRYTFWIDGQEVHVHVDEHGLIYGQQLYRRPGLLGLMHLAGVP